MLWHSWDFHFYLDKMHSRHLNICELMSLWRLKTNVGLLFSNTDQPELMLLDNKIYSWLHYNAQWQTDSPCHVSALRVSFLFYHGESKSLRVGGIPFFIVPIDEHQYHSITMLVMYILNVLLKLLLRGNYYPNVWQQNWLLSETLSRGVSVNYQSAINHLAILTNLIVHVQ